MRMFAVLLIFPALALIAVSAAAADTAFTYQGKLTDSAGVTLTGSYDMTFKLYDALTAGNQVGSTVTLTGVSVSGGLFTVSLDFGASAFNTGESRWIETTIGTVTLSPRVAVTSVPSAVYAQTVPWSGVTGAPTSLPPSGTAGGDLTGTYPNPTVGEGKIDSTKIMDGTVTSTDLASDAASLSKVTGGAASVSGGNVGIGTTSPGFPLNFATALGDKISFHGDSGNHYGIGIQNYLLQIHTGLSNSDIAFGYGQSSSMTETMRIKGTGNVGIGTASPTAKLDVNGTAKMTGFQLGTTATAGQVLTSNSSGVGTWQALPTSLPPSGTAGGDLTGTYPNPTVGAGKIDSIKILDGTVALADMGANSVDAAKIVDASVASAELASDSASLSKVTGGAARVAGTNIGIGTSTAGFPLTFTNTVGDKISLYGQSGANYGFGVQSNLLQIHSSAASADIAFGYGESAAMTETVRFKGNGNVGIGTTAPASKLDVAGMATADTLDVRGASLLAAPLDVSTRGWTLEQAQTTSNVYINGSGAMWQSFTAGAAGSLVGVALLYGATDRASDWASTLAVYEGEGTSGTQLTSQRVVGDGQFRLRMFLLDSPVPLTAGTKYTIYMNSDISCTWDARNADVYAGGRSSYNAAYDFWFRTYLDAGTLVSAMSVQPGTGNVGIGTSAPGFPLTFANVMGDKISLWNTGSASYGFGIQSSRLQIHTDSSASDIVFGYGDSAAMTERMRVKGNGNVGIGTASPSYTLHVNGTVGITSLPQADKRNVQWDPTTGQLYQAVSSRRYKDNILPLSDDFEKFLQLEPKTYSYKTDQSGYLEIGYIAEDVDALGLKNLVHYDEQGRPDALKYEKMVIYLNEVVKRQQRQIDDQQKQIDELKKLVTEAVKGK